MNIEDIATSLLEKELTLSTVESCTGGGIAAHCTDLAGSSNWFLGGVVTYSNDMKIKLGVQQQDLAEHGAVSEAVARQMAEQGRAYCASDWSIAVTGVAGPGGGSVEKPVGTVWIAWSCKEFTQAERFQFNGDRSEIRRLTADSALQKLLDFLN